MVLLGGVVLLVTQQTFLDDFGLTGAEVVVGGIVDILLGMVALLLSSLMWIGEYDTLIYLGTGAIVIGLTSLAFGGGLLVGTALTVTGGIMAVAWRPGPAYVLIPND